MFYKLGIFLTLICLFWLFFYGDGLGIFKSRRNDNDLINLKIKPFLELTKEERERYQYYKINRALDKYARFGVLGGVFLTIIGIIAK